MYIPYVIVHDKYATYNQYIILVIIDKFHDRNSFKDYCNCDIGRSSEPALCVCDIGYTALTDFVDSMDIWSERRNIFRCTPSISATHWVDKIREYVNTFGFSSIVGEYVDDEKCRFSYTKYKMVTISEDVIKLRRFIEDECIRLKKVESLESIAFEKLREFELTSNIIALSS